MTTLTESQYPGEFIIAEPAPEISREKVTVTAPASTKLEPGHVMAQLTATGKWVPYDNAGSDGSEEAAGILYTEVDNEATASPTDFTSAVMVVRLAAVRKADLQWDSGVDASGKTAAYADLKAVMITALD